MLIKSRKMYNLEVSLVFCVLTTFGVLISIQLELAAIFVGILFLTASFYRPYFGLCILCALIPLEGILPALFSVSTVKLGGILLAVRSVPEILKMGKLRIYKNLLRPGPIIYSNFVLWVVLSILWAKDKGLAIRMSKTHISLLVFYILLIFLPKKNNSTLHIKCFVIGSMISILTIPMAAINYRSIETRLAGGGLNENDYAATMAIALCLSVAWFWREHSFIQRITPLLFFPVGIIAIGLTKSRGGTVATLPLFVFIIVIMLEMKLGKRLIWGSILLFTVFALTQIIPSGYFGRVTDIKAAIADRFTLRIFIWHAGIKMFLDHLVLGVGAGNFTQYVQNYSEITLWRGYPAHNSFISVAAELGIVGLLLFASLIIYHCWILIFKFKTKVYTSARKISYGLKFSLAVYLIASLSLTWEYRKVLPFILGSSILLIRKD